MREYEVCLNTALKIQGPGFTDAIKWYNSVDFNTFTEAVMKTETSVSELFLRY